MKFKGYSKTFSTMNQEQYETIGSFWDEMASRYGRENLVGLGYNWTESSIEYVIGLKEADIRNDLEISDAAYKVVFLPDSDWIQYSGRTDKLSELYAEIYSQGPLRCELEMFDDNGNCRIAINRNKF